MLRQISTNLYVACAITMILIAGGIDLSAGAVISLSSVVVSTCMVNYGLPIPLAILAALAIGCAIGFLNGTLIYKTGLPPFIVTYAVQCICQGVAYVWTGAQPIRLTDRNFIFLGTGFVFGVIPMPLIYLAVVAVFVWYILNRTKLGRHIYAVGGNEKAAEFSGVNIKKVRWFVYAFSGTMAALAGVVLTARMYSGQPAVGAGGEMDAIAAVVLGGTSMGGGRSAHRRYEQRPEPGRCGQLLADGRQGLHHPDRSLCGLREAGQEAPYLINKTNGIWRVECPPNPYPERMCFSWLFSRPTFSLHHFASART